MKTLAYKHVLSFLVTSFLFVAAIVLGNAYAQIAQGSNNAEASDYMATSTAASNAYGAFTIGRVIRKGSGSFGSVIITGANTGIVNIYDATTTDVTLRTGQTATSTILLASFPASTAAGTYTFDAVYKQGLYVDLVAGNMPTTTITFR